MKKKRQKKQTFVNTNVRFSLYHYRVLKTAIQVSLIIGNLGVASLSASEEPYDVSSYHDRPTDELKTLVMDYTICPAEEPPDKRQFFYRSSLLGDPESEHYVRESTSTPDVDTDWRILTDIHQVLIQRDSENERGLDCLYSDSIMRMYLFDGMIDDKRILPFSAIDGLFGYWKRVAWVNPVDTEALIHALETGYDSKLSPRPEWVDQWKKREMLLRSSSKFYLPQTSNLSSSDWGKFNISKFYQLLKRLPK